MTEALTDATPAAAVRTGRAPPLETSRPVTKRSLLVLSHAMERAFDRGDPGLVLALFQERRHFDVEAERYAGLAGAGNAVVVAFAGPVDDVPPGVHAVQLAVDDPLCRTWALVLLSAALGTSLRAEDTLRLAPGEETLQASRLFDAAWTFDRHRAAEQGGQLLAALGDRLPADVQQRARSHVDAATATAMTLGEAQLIAAAEHLVNAVDAGALRSSRMRAELEDSRYLAERDHLTGLHNRVYLERFLHGAGGTANTGVLLVDLDGLKQINDRLGHRAGDAALAGVAACLRATCRSGDVLIRWGGDEFLLLLPGTDAAGSLRIAERITAAVAAAQMPAPWQDVRLSVSIGVSGDASDPLPLDALDEALSAVKRAGKGRARLVDGGRPVPPAT